MSDRIGKDQITGKCLTENVVGASECAGGSFYCRDQATSKCLHFVKPSIIGRDSTGLCLP